MIRTRGGCIALALGSWLVAACAAPPRLAPLPPGDPRPAALLARWRADLDGREALRGSARLSVDAEALHGGDDLRVRSKQRVVVARPGRLRVEVEGLLGTTAAVLAVDEAEYAFFEADSHHFESGPVHPHLLWDVVGLDLTPSEAVGLLLGAPELPEDLRILAAHDAGDGTTRITLGAPGSGAPLRAIDLDREARLRRYAVWTDAREPEWIAELDGYEEVAGTPFAHRLSVETRNGAKAEVSLRSVELNPSLSPDIFRLDRLRPASGRPAGAAEMADAVETADAAETGEGG